MQKRKSPPPKYLIAEYWAEHEPEFVQDIGEPSCFACGWYQEKWEPVLDSDGTFNARRTWNVRLEVAHLVPYMIGGSNDVSNLVLLCHECHTNAPSSRNPRYMLEWMRNRPYYVQALTDEFLADPQFRRLALSVNRVTRLTLTPEFRQFFMENAGYSCTETRAAKFRTMLAMAEEFTGLHPRRLVRKTPFSRMN